MWRIEIDRRAEQELRKLPDAILQRIANRIQLLTKNPFPQGIKKLQSQIGFRLRVGDYRVLYNVNHQRKLITVYAVGHRRDVYR